MTRPPRAALASMYAGLALTVVALITPYLDRDVLADHIRAGYPTYSPQRVDDAVTTWLVILTVIGVLGIAGWVSTIWATQAGRPWTRWAATAGVGVGTTVALTAALTRDTSGEVGLPPLFGVLVLLPCLAGVVAVALLWRRPD